MGSAVQDVPSSAPLKPFPAGPLIPKGTTFGATSVGPEFFRPDMPIESLARSPLNPRKHFDQAAIEELSKSIQSLGILEPILARPVGDHYEIVAGERRFRAAALAGLKVVPVIAKSLSDAQALEIMVVENNQREDVSALEESDGFKQLLATGYDLDRLAERIGRSKKYIYDRMKLKDLVPTARTLVSEGRLAAGHAILLARLKPEDQERAIDPDAGHKGYGGSGAFQSDHTEPGDDEDQDDPYVGLKAVSVRELDHWIAKHVRFDVAHFAKAAPLEYGELGTEVAAAAAKPGRGKKVIAITFDHFVQPEARDASDRTYGPQSFKFADGKPHLGRYNARAEQAPKCEHSVLGVVAAGAEHYGRSFTVCVARDRCQVHWKKEIVERTKNQKLRDTGQAAKADRNEAKENASHEARQKKAAEDARRERLAEARAIDLVLDKATDHLTPDLLRLVLVQLLNGDMDHDGFNARFKTKVNWGATAATVKSLTGRTLVQAVVYASLSQDLVAGMDGGTTFKPFKVDYHAIRGVVAKEEDAKALAAKPVQTSAKKTKSSAKKKR